MSSRITTFFGGSSGLWRVEKQHTVIGAPIEPVARVAVVPGGASPRECVWGLRGVTSNTRYASGAEVRTLQERQPALDRPEATRAVLIPIRKNAGWWALAQDQRHEIVEARSRHISKGTSYLPAIARKLHHCRDLGEDQPFDFLTWFEFAPADEGAFDELLHFLRSSEEWRFVDREVELRLVRD
jgi:hypothetical protein